MNNIVLVGFAATGKSTVGAQLAQKLGRAFVDTDCELERLLGESVAQFIRREGEQAFRNSEDALLSQLADSSDCVIACGGGSVLCEHFAQLKRNATVVWLFAQTDTVAPRLNSDRPLFDGMDRAELQNAVERRNALYAAVADVRIPTDGLSPQQVLDAILLAI